MADRHSPLIHVTFGQSAAGSLKMALATLGRAEPVLALADDLSFGPLDVTDHLERARWCSDNLGFEDDPELSAMTDEFWRTVTAHGTDVVAWMSRRCLTEYCGFLELRPRRRFADHRAGPDRPGSSRLRE
jgi:hypothetical protein